MSEESKTHKRQEILINLYIQYLRQEITMGELLVYLRKNILGLSQAEYADLVGISRRTLSKLEVDKGEPSEAILNKVFKPLGLKSGLVPTHVHVTDKFLKNI